MKKNTIKLLILAAGLGLATSGCKNFDDINKSPTAATAEQVRPLYFLTNSISGAQMDPNVAERSFILYWKNSGHQQAGTTFVDGNTNDQWTGVYWSEVSEWLKNANLAITIGKEKAENGTATNYNENIIQISRIWRAYLLSELSDNFGPAPIEAFQGVNPDFVSVKDVYYYMLAELDDAVAKIDPTVTGMDDKTKDGDQAYRLDWEKWIRYGNSLRMRLAMRLSEVDPAKAQAEFEDAVATNQYISSTTENFSVVEEPGWHDMTGVMTRSWNPQVISATLNNTMLNLGGIKSVDQLGGPENPVRDSILDSYVKPADYIGLKFKEQFPTYVNDPSNGYFLDGLPYSIDPRAYANFAIPGDFTSPIYPSWFVTDEANLKREMIYEDKSKVIVDTKYTWSTYVAGNWGKSGTRNGIADFNPRYTPAIGWQYRNSENRRVFFGSWESYFLIAEAAVRGWAVPMSAEAAYNKGIQESLDYNGVGQYYADYINSTDYNRNGTSVKFSHTTEPGATHAMTYKDPKTGDTGTVAIPYPVNNMYKNGAVRNDQLTKIITQKFIANTPWLPLETWSDHRRLGLPFFENPAVDSPLPNMPHLTTSNYMESSIKNFPQRLPYPSSFRNADPEGYQKAVELLGPSFQGGNADVVNNPLWWAIQQ